MGCPPPPREEPIPRGEPGRLLQSSQGRICGGNNRPQPPLRPRASIFPEPSPSPPTQVPEVCNTSAGWKVKGVPPARIPFTCAGEWAPAVPLSQAQPAPEAPSSLHNPGALMLPALLQASLFGAWTQACPRVFEVAATSWSPSSRPSRPVSVRPLVGARARRPSGGTHRVTVPLGRRLGSGGSGRSPPPHTTLLRAGLGAPPLSPLGRSPEHLQLRMGTGQPGAPRVSGARSSSHGSSGSSRRAGAPSILRPAAPISPSPRGDPQLWGPSVRRPEGPGLAGGVLSGGPGRPRAGRGALGGGKPRDPRRRAPGACPASAPAGRTRARLSARRGRPPAARPESLRGAAGPPEAGPLRVACSLRADLEPSGSRRAPAAAAAAAAPCHGWRQLGAAPLPPPPAPARAPERAPSPRQLASREALAPSATQPRSCTPPSESRPRGLRPGASPNSPRAYAPSPSRAAPLPRAGTLPHHNPSQPSKPTTTTFHKTLPRSCSSSPHLCVLGPSLTCGFGQRWLVLPVWGWD